MFQEKGDLRGFQIWRRSSREDQRRIGKSESQRRKIQKENYRLHYGRVESYSFSEDAFNIGLVYQGVEIRNKEIQD